MRLPRLNCSSLGLLGSLPIETGLWPASNIDFRGGSGRRQPPSGGVWKAEALENMGVWPKEKTKLDILMLSWPKAKYVGPTTQQGCNSKRPLSGPTKNDGDCAGASSHRHQQVVQNRGLLLLCWHTPCKNPYQEGPWQEP